MKLLDINDTGVGNEVARIEVTRDELETIFMYCDMGIFEARLRAEALTHNFTTRKAGESLQLRLNEESDMVGVVSGILSLFEVNDNDDGPQEALV